MVDISGEAVVHDEHAGTAPRQYRRLPIKVFILNNQWMGMVRQWQELLHGARYSESYSEALPDFVKLAEAFGGVGLRATKRRIGRRDRRDDRHAAPVIADIMRRSKRRTASR